MGGMVAQELVATRAAGRCTRWCWPAPHPPSANRGRLAGEAFVADRLAPLDAGLGMAGVAERLVPGDGVDQAVAEAQPRAMAVMARVPEATYRAGAAGHRGLRPPRCAAAIAVPTLCLAGEHDKTAPPEVMQRMAGKIPGAVYQCLPGAGHIANVEQPDAFNMPRWSAS
jgi:3-oxoadipate enol-lactonase